MTTDVIYNHETIVLDGQVFSNCEFRHSRMVYAGGEPPIFTSCRFDACEWKFDDAAARTLQHLKTVWGVGAKASVQGLIKDITGAAR